MLVTDFIVGTGAAKTAKRSRSSRKGKRPLSSCAVPAPKQPKLLKEEGKVVSGLLRVRVGVTLRAYERV